MSWLDRPASDTQITHRGRLWLYVVGTLVMVFLLAPTLIVMPMSFSASQYLEFPPSTWSVLWYESYLNSPEWMQATWTSVKVAVLTVFVATPLGTMAAYGLFVSNFRFAKLLFVLLVLPMMVPVILVGIGCFYVFAKLNLVHTVFGLVLAHSILAIPLVLVIVSASLKSYDMNQEMVARSLGATRFKAFMVITLPQIRFSVVTGGLLAFLTSFDEVIIGLFVSGGQNSLLTKKMFTALRDLIDPTIASISTILIVISCTALLLAQYMGRTKEDN